MKPSRKSIVIIGGGASGVLLAAHLLRRGPDAARVTLIERRRTLGQGVAYSSHFEDHVLNVPAPKMSAYAEDPDHFWRWLLARNLVDDGDRFVFVPRRHYGAYLADVLAEASAGSQLTLMSDEATDLRVTGGGVEIALSSGASVVGHAAVIAVGHETRPSRSRDLAVQVGSEDDTPLDSGSPVLILGSGLSMVDAWLRLEKAGHAGAITVVSRHGLLPQSHRDVEKVELEAADVPFGTDLHYFEHWFRETVAEVKARGGNWRSVVDAIRPFNQRIWQGWSEKSRRRFLEHLRPFWNVHRHRVPEDLHNRLTNAVTRGQVTVRAAKLIGLDRLESGQIAATIRGRGKQDNEMLRVSRVYDCGGLATDVDHSSNKLIASLVRRGDARADALHIGLDVTSNCEVIARDGMVSSRLRAIGPLTRGTFYEIEAIPDIRVQVENVAESLVEESRASSFLKLY